MNHNRPLRVLHCPTTVGGNPQGLARAERELGLESTTIVSQQNYFNYNTDEVLWNSEASYYSKCKQLRRTFYRAASSFDVIHYNFGSRLFDTLEYPTSWKAPERKHFPFATIRPLYSYGMHILANIELPLLKMLRKGLFVTYQGDDARQGDYSTTHFPICVANEVEPPYYTPESDTDKRIAIRRFDQYADKIYALNPDLLHVLPSHAEFLPYASVDPRDFTPEPPAPQPSKPLRILHAPSHRGAKGTKYILAAIERLQNIDNLQFEFILIENLSHAEALKLYRTADLLVDQLLYGWYGGLTVELMAMGKPVVCYIRDDDLTFVPEQMRVDLPIIKTTPSTIYEVLKSLLTERMSSLYHLGIASRRYVEKWHDPRTIAKRVINDYRSALGLSTGHH